MTMTQGFGEIEDWVIHHFTWISKESTLMGTNMKTKPNCLKYCNNCECKSLIYNYNYHSTLLRFLVQKIQITKTPLVLPGTCNSINYPIKLSSRLLIWKSSQSSFVIWYNYLNSLIFFLEQHKEKINLKKRRKSMKKETSNLIWEQVMKTHLWTTSRLTIEIAQWNLARTGS